MFDSHAKSVTFIGEKGPLKVVKPIGVAIDAADTVFVADATLKRVVGYRPDGTVAIAIGHEGELENPSGLAIDRGRAILYVADAKKHQVLCYSSTDGVFIRAIGKRGTEAGEFNFPTNLSVDRSGRLYVTASVTDYLTPAGTPNHGGNNFEVFALNIHDGSVLPGSVPVKVFASSGDWGITYWQSPEELP